MTTAVDISTILPEDMRLEFEEHYAKQDRITWDFLASCSRCGAAVSSALREVHELWHKNISVQMWMMKGWPIAHISQHERETAAFQAVIAGILGFIDPEAASPPVTYEGHPPENPGAHCGTYEEEVEADELRADGKVVAHIHKDGTTHEH